MAIEKTQNKRTPKKWFVIPLIFIAVFIFVDNFFFTDYYSSGPPSPPTLDQNATEVQIQGYAERIHDLEKLLSTTQEENEQLLVYQRLFINSQKRSSLILQRYSQKIKRNIVEDQRNMGVFITPDSKGVIQINKEIPQKTFFLTLIIISLIIFITIMIRSHVLQKALKNGQISKLTT